MNSFFSLTYIWKLTMCYKIVLEIIKSVGLYGSHLRSSSPVSNSLLANTIGCTLSLSLHFSLNVKISCLIEGIFGSPFITRLGTYQEASIDYYFQDLVLKTLCEISRLWWRLSPIIRFLKSVLPSYDNKFASKRRSQFDYYDSLVSKRQCSENKYLVLVRRIVCPFLNIWTLESEWRIHIQNDW